MSYKNPDILAETDWLARHLDAPDVRIVDASWYMPAEGRNARDEYRKAHIPGAVFFDIDEVCDHSNPLPHMLPEPEQFSAAARKLGLGDGSRIVVYDGAGVFSAARVWWMFRVFGHEDVALLNGGLPKWKQEGWPLEAGEVSPQPRHLTARINHALIRDLRQMRMNLQNQAEQVVDARSPERFAGTVQEPRAGVRPGHIPGSVNIPYSSLLDPQTNTFLPPDRLAAIFADAGIQMSRPITTTCGSGVTASILAFALDLLGHSNVAVYDGSWAQWGALPDTPVET
ncbi:MAG: 3-mercaptopyruvate sulfurtransferase [Alphaproteobacteria bacterium]